MSCCVSTAIVATGINLSGSQSLDGSQIGGSSIGRGSLNRGNFNRGSVASNVSGSFGKPSTSTLASLTGNTLGKQRGLIHATVFDENIGE